MAGPGKVESLIIERAARKTLIAALVDPEDLAPEEAGKLAKAAEDAGASIILVGGSTVADQSGLDEVVQAIKGHVTCNVILFPGNVTGVSRFADAILFSSLLNSTNPYFIIGAQAIGAMHVYRSKVEAIPMAYLVFGNSSTTRRPPGASTRRNSRRPASISPKLRRP